MNKKYIILGAAFTLGLLSYIILPSPDAGEGIRKGQGNMIEEQVDIEPVHVTYEDLQLIAGSRKEAESQEAVDIPVDNKDKEQDAYYQQDEIWNMTRIVYLENGITYPECTYETIYLTACVILNRMYDWEECHSIIDVIFEDGQYSTAYMYEDYDGSALGTSNPEGWKISEQAVADALEDCNRNPHFQGRSRQGEVYYIDPYTGEVFCY